MTTGMTQSEIRQSTINRLLEKVRKGSYDKYLLKLKLERFRQFVGATLSFDFPVLALIGPNGGGKTTVLSACACVYSEPLRQKAFLRSAIGDEVPPDWAASFDLLDRQRNPRGSVFGEMFYKGLTWKISDVFSREVVFLTLMRTLPLAENPRFQLRSRLVRNGKGKYVKIEFETENLPEDTAARIRLEGERVLGKSLTNYNFFTAKSTTTKIKRRRVRGSPNVSSFQTDVGQGSRPMKTARKLLKAKKLM